MIVSGSLGVQAADLLPPADLRCEFLINPQGIVIQSNRVLAGDLSGLSEAKRKRPIGYWWLPSGLLAKDQGDLWDSGKVTSDQSIHVEYTGKELKSGMFCYWKVQAWDKTGRLSSWSDTPAMWSMGLLSPEDWKAKWIQAGRRRRKTGGE